MKVPTLFVAFAATGFLEVASMDIDTLPGPDANGVYPYKWYPNNDAPDGINFLDTNGTVDSSVRARNNDMSLESRQAPPPFFTACNGGFSESLNDCSGKCSPEPIAVGQCLGTPGTQCISFLHPGDQNSYTVSNRGCGDTSGKSIPVYQQVRQRCKQGGGCFDVPGTQSVTQTG